MENQAELFHRNFWNYTYDDVPCSYLFAACDSPPHTHEDFYEFSLITAGSFINDYDGSRRTLRKNSLIFFHVGETHSIYVGEPESVHFSFIIKKHYFEDFCRHYFDEDYSGRMLEKKYAEAHLTDTQGDYLTSLANLMVNTAKKDHFPMFNYFIYSCLFFSFVDVPYSSVTSWNDKYVEDLLVHLNNYHFINSELSSVYSKYPVAQCTLTTLFKKRTGYTIVQYRNIKRLEYASQLLASGLYTIADVANQVNISCLGYFSKEFKRQYGVSPKEFQRLHQSPPHPEEAEGKDS